MSLEQQAKSRLGNITASRFRTVVRGTPKGKLSLWKQLCQEKRWVEEGAPQAKALIERFANPASSGQACRWGLEYEDEARRMFALVMGIDPARIRPGGYVRHPGHLRVGCSPDGLIVAPGRERVDHPEMPPYEAGLEIKVPFREEIHQQYCDEFPADKHGDQVYGSMWVTGIPTWYFVSYDPRVHKLGKRVGHINIRKIQWNRGIIRKLERSVLAFADQLKFERQPQDLNPFGAAAPELF